MFQLFIAILIIISYLTLCLRQPLKILQLKFQILVLYGQLHGFNKITSNFGPRKSPTTGSSSNHQGIDIGAPVGTNILAIQDGIVTSTKFSGAGGYTVIIKHDDTYTSNYCHVDPNFLVYPNQKVYKGQIIAKVGPKNVYGVPNNPYKDSTGKPTNGATTGPHLHLGVRKNGKFISPLSLYN